jgi:hypothetical protein
VSRRAPNSYSGSLTREHVLSEQTAIVKDNLGVMVRVAYKSALNGQLKNSWVGVRSDQLIEQK